MIFIDIDKPNLIDIHNYLIRNIRIDLIKNNNILGKDILEFKYRNRQCDIMILNNNVIAITIRQNRFNERNYSQKNNLYLKNKSDIFLKKQTKGEDK